MFVLGTLINVATIVVGGSLGMTVKGDLSPHHQAQLRKYVGLGVIVAGFHLLWTGLRPLTPWVALGVLGISLLATTLGQWLGKVARLQVAMNRAGRFAAETFARARLRPSSISFNDGFLACTALYCVGPLSILGPLEEGINGQFLVLAVKSVMDGLAAFAFARVFGWSVIFAGLPVLALQGTITLLTLWATGTAPKMECASASLATAGLLVICSVLLVFEVRKVQLGDFLPALFVAPALAWLFF